MGPRSFDRGKGWTRSNDTRRPASFNGAAIFRSRKGFVTTNKKGDVILLQWGRDLSIAERSTTPAAPPRSSQSFNGAAIFRSRKGGCGCLGTSGRTTCFNGAAIFRSRKVYICTQNRTANNMLQWGRDLSIAESRNLEPPRSSQSALQWGRDLSIAERLPVSSTTSTSVTASMGPRSFDRGKDGCVTPLIGAGKRFNGAAIFRSRKVLREDGVKLRGSGLQWGRDLSIAESVPGR